MLRSTANPRLGQKEYYDALIEFKRSNSFACLDDAVGALATEHRAVRPCDVVPVTKLHDILLEAGCVNGFAEHKETSDGTRPDPSEYNSQHDELGEHTFHKLIMPNFATAWIWWGAVGWLSVFRRNDISKPVRGRRSPPPGGQIV